METVETTSSKPKFSLRKFRWFIISAFVIAGGIITWIVTNVNDSSSDYKKLQFIRAKVDKAFQGDKKVKSLSAVLKDVGKKLSLDVLDRNIPECESLLIEMLWETDQKFPHSDQVLIKNFQKDAELIYLPVFTEGEYIKVQYVLNNKTFTCQGTLSSISSSRIRVGNKWINIRDLNEQYRYSFDEREFKNAKVRYVRRKISEYYSQKDDYLNSLIEANEHFMHQRRYIRFHNRWQSPREITVFFYQNKLLKMQKEQDDSLYKRVSRRYNKIKTKFKRKNLSEPFGIKKRLTN